MLHRSFGCFPTRRLSGLLDRAAYVSFDFDSDVLVAALSRKRAHTWAVDMDEMFERKCWTMGPNSDLGKLLIRRFANKRSDSCKSLSPAVRSRILLCRF